MKDIVKHVIECKVQDLEKEIKWGTEKADALRERITNIESHLVRERYEIVQLKEALCILQEAESS